MCVIEQKHKICKYPSYSERKTISKKCVKYPSYSSTKALLKQRHHNNWSSHIAMAPLNHLSSWNKLHGSCTQTNGWKLTENAGYHQFVVINYMLANWWEHAIFIGITVIIPASKYFLDTRIFHCDVKQNRNYEWRYGTCANFLHVVQAEDVIKACSNLYAVRRHNETLDAALSLTLWASYSVNVATCRIWLNLNYNVVHLWYFLHRY